MIRSFLIVAIGLAVAATFLRSKISAQTPSANPGRSVEELAVLRAEVERLKGMAPDQSHAMKDVAYHFANLWFAGKEMNWPLAEFYWSETRSHLRWAVRIIPVRKDPQGHEIRLSEILDPIEKASLQKVGEAIKVKDKALFSEAYKQMLESCYSCHLAAGKPFLKLQIPVQPEVPIIQFAPHS